MKISEDDVMKVIELAGVNGILKRDLAKDMGMDPAYRAEQLINAGLITKRRDGMQMRYYVKPKTGMGPLPHRLPALLNANLPTPAPAPVNPNNTTHPPVYELKKEIVVRKSELDKLVNEFVDALASSITERLRPMIVEKLSNSVAVMTAEIANNVANVPEKIKLPSIFVGGLHSDQIQMIKKEFEGVADLRFAVADDDAGLWKSRAANAQHTLLMVDFLSHKHIEMVKATGVVPIILRGGLTKMRDKLMEMSV